MHLYHEEDSSDDVSSDDQFAAAEQRQLLAHVRINSRDLFGGETGGGAPTPSPGGGKRGGPNGADHHHHARGQPPQSCCCCAGGGCKRNTCCGCLCRNTCKQNVCSVVVGALLGVAVYWGTTCVLYAISVNAVASVVCGCSLLVISCTIAVRAANPFTESTETAKLFTLAFTVVLFLAAIFCFLLDKKVILMERRVKVPLYVVAGRRRLLRKATRNQRSDSPHLNSACGSCMQN